MSQHVLPPPAVFTQDETLHAIPLSPLATFLSEISSQDQLIGLDYILTRYRTPKSYNRVDVREVESSELPPASGDEADAEEEDQEGREGTRRRECGRFIVLETGVDGAESLLSSVDIVPPAVHGVDGDKSQPTNCTVKVTPEETTQLPESAQYCADTAAVATNGPASPKQAPSDRPRRARLSKATTPISNPTTVAQPSYRISTPTVLPPKVDKRTPVGFTDVGCGRPLCIGDVEKRVARIKDAGYGVP